jgi:hypothetical protein
VKIGQNSLPSNHPTLQGYLKELADIKKKEIVMSFLCVVFGKGG